MNRNNDIPKKMSFELKSFSHYIALEKGLSDNTLESAEARAKLKLLMENKQ